MPIEVDAPHIALSARYDLRTLSGADAWDFGGSPLTLPTWSGKAGIYRDIIELLVGHGAELSIGDDLQAQWAADGGAGTVAITMHSTGVVAVTNASGGDDLELEASADNAAWGLPTAGATIGDGETLLGEPYPVGPPGVLGETPPYLTFARGASTFDVPAVPRYFADVRCSLRTRSMADDLDTSGRTPATECLEALENDAFDDATRRISYAISLGPRVRVYRAVGLGVSGADSALTDVNATLAALLGLGGSETPVATGGTGRDVYVTAYDLHPVGLLTPTTARESLRPWASVEQQGRWTRDGRRFVRRWSGPKGWTLDCRLDGPADLDDQHRAWVEETWDMMHAGPVCLFARWGDSRRMQWRGDEGTLYTAAAGGYRGRVYVALEDTETWVEWPTGLMAQAPLSLKLRTQKQGTADT